MNEYMVSNMNEMERQLEKLVGEFQRSIAEGRPFTEVKAIYLEIKELKVVLGRQNGKGDDWMKGLSSAYAL